MRFYTKYLAFLTGVVAMVVATTACTHDDVVGTTPEGGEETMVSFVLTTDEAEGEETRAISDGTTVDLLYYAIYNENGEIVIPKATRRNATGLTSESGLTMYISLPAGRNYKAVFWAQSSKTEAYTLTDDMTVDVNYAVACNDENCDAFYGVTEFFATTDDGVEVTLRRPFAQLNAGTHTFDWEYVTGYHNFDVTKSCVRVRDVAHTIDLRTGELSNYGSASFKPGVLPTEYLKADVDEDGAAEEYVYVAMAYLLADTTPTTHTAEFFFLNDENKAVMYEHESANNVTLERNCRTDYVGQVVTDNGYINVRDYVDEPNTDYGYIYYNSEEDTTFENTIYNMSSHETGLQFASTNGQVNTYNNLLFTGDIWVIELGEYRGGGYVNYNNVLNNVELRNLSVSACIECHEWYFSPATIAYGKTTLNNCKMTGATTIRDTVTDKHGVVHKVIPCDIGVRNESDAWFYGGEYGTVFAWTHAVVELYDVKIDTLYCGTCDSTKHSWMTIGAGTTIDKVICCEPRCPYGGKEYSTTMTIKKGATVGSLQLVSTDVEFLIIEDGAKVGPITCEGVEYTYEELRAAMGL